jgi:hypothetical protein
LRRGYVFIAPPWSPLYRKLQQHSSKPLDNPTVHTLPAGTDSPGSPSTEFEPAPKDSKALVTERVESSPEIPKTPAVALEKMRREEDSHSEDGNTPSHAYGRWSTETDRI